MYFTDTSSMDIRLGPVIPSVLHGIPGMISSTQQQLNQGSPELKSQTSSQTGN